MKLASRHGRILLWPDTARARGKGPGGLYTLFTRAVTYITAELDVNHDFPGLIISRDWYYYDAPPQDRRVPTESPLNWP